MFWVRLAPSLMVAAISLWMIRRGYVDGVRRQQITVKYDRYEGDAAKRIGWIVVSMGGVGVLLAVVLLVFAIARS